MRALLVVLAWWLLLPLVMLAAVTHALPVLLGLCGIAIWGLHWLRRAP